MESSMLTSQQMVKQRRGKSRILFAIPNGAISLPPPTTQTPLFLFGTTTPPQLMDAAFALPLLPQSIIDNIIDHLFDEPADLRVCSLVAKNWTARSQSHLFHKVTWTRETVLGWCKRARPRPDGLAKHATVLVVVSLLERDRLGSIKDYFTSFRNVASLTVRGVDFDDPLFNPKKVPIYFGHLKPTLTSLTLVNANGSCGKLLSFVSFFPHLEHITLCSPGNLVPPDPTINLQYRPLRGTLFLQGHLGRQTDLIKLLSRAAPPRCHTIRLEHWGRMHVDDLDSLLGSCSKSLEVLDVSACKEEQFSRLRPNFSLCPRLTEFRIQLLHIARDPPNIINTLLISPIVLTRITFVIHKRMGQEDIISYVRHWTEMDIMIVRFAAKLYCRSGGKRLLLTFVAIGALDFTPLVPHSIERGVEVVVKRDDDMALTWPTCVSCEMEYHGR